MLPLNRTWLAEGLQNRKIANEHVRQTFREMWELERFHNDPPILSPPSNCTESSAVPTTALRTSTSSFEGLVTFLRRWRNRKIHWGHGSRKSSGWEWDEEVWFQRMITPWHHLPFKKIHDFCMLLCAHPTESNMNLREFDMFPVTMLGAWKKTAIFHQTFAFLPFLGSYVWNITAVKTLRMT